MQKYTIYCTAEQTKKALELGAPIYTTNEHLYNHPHEYMYWVEVDIQGNFYAAKIPTAEQMISWLEEQGVFISIVPDTDENTCANYVETKEFSLSNVVCSTRKEVTLSAIDTALEYLTITRNKNV